MLLMTIITAWENAARCQDLMTSPNNLPEKQNLAENKEWVEILHFIIFLSNTCTATSICANHPLLHRRSSSPNPQCLCSRSKGKHFIYFRWLIVLLPGCRSARSRLEADRIQIVESIIHKSSPSHVILIFIHIEIYIITSKGAWNPDPTWQESSKR